jgi:hypothetical protein
MPAFLYIAIVSLAAYFYTLPKTGKENGDVHALSETSGGDSRGFGGSEPRPANQSVGQPVVFSATPIPSEIPPEKPSE